MSQVPSIGRIVFYKLTEHDADAINRRRSDAEANRALIATDALGYVAHVGNAVAEGDVFPMTIVRVWGDQPTSAVNGQVTLDGNDTFWATSRVQGDGEGKWAWPVFTR